MPGKLILSVIYSSPEALQSAVMKFEKKFGHVELETEILDFAHTDYYREEMGDKLKRKFFAFEKMVRRDQLSDIKLFSNKLEEKFGDKTGDFVFRTVNLDPGIMTLSGLTLASTKDFSHRIYLNDGIYAEITLIYEKKQFKPLPWTYPDYQEPNIIEFLTKVRETMKKMEFE